MGSKEDHALIRRVRQGDLQAADAIVHKYYDDIFAYCRCHTLEVHTAEDLTQDTFLSFFSSLASYRHRGKLLNCLFTIARNKCSEEIKKKRNTNVSIDFVAAGALSGCAETPKTEDQILVEQAVNSLPEELREVTILYFFMDVKQREIAGICGIGLPLVKYRIRQAKEKIKKYLEGDV
ncbi:MAG: RNA polymerase sigma factor [Anaerovoracaceae bacterium]|jgi:RNA polymerase sigma factor (sigma-70 family)